MATLARINVTPVKGMALLHPDRVQVTSRGIPADRRFYLVDGSGRTVAGSGCGRLVQIVPAYDPGTETLSMRFPDGEEISGAADALGEATQSDFYGRPVAAHVVHGPWASAVSRLVGRPLRLLRADRDGDGIDVFPLTLVSRASVDDLAARGHHEGPLDSRRFRINFELDGCRPYEEDSWDGRSVAAGEAVVSLDGAIPRCVVTTQDPTNGTKDWDTLTQIAKYRHRIPGDGGLPFGMYATVDRPGTVRLGDAVLPR